MPEVEPPKKPESIGDRNRRLAEENVRLEQQALDEAEELARKPTFIVTKTETTIYTVHDEYVDDDADAIAKVAGWESEYLSHESGPTAYSVQRIDPS